MKLVAAFDGRADISGVEQTRQAEKQLTKSRSCPLGNLGQEKGRGVRCRFRLQGFG